MDLSRMCSMRSTNDIQQESNVDIQQEALRASISLSDEELLSRARTAHKNENFKSLSAGPEANGTWKRVEAADSFVVFRRHVESNSQQEKRTTRLEIMCAGFMDASIEEVASILQSSSEAEHNAAMHALYTKSFIFGSYEREVSCSEPGDTTEQLAVKTKSFVRTTMLGHNEQWCYFDYFQRKKERDGFTISKRALSPLETTPGRIVGENARVDQLHGLNASYLVHKLPNRGGLRVVFHAWFDLNQSFTNQITSMRSSSLNYEDANKRNAQLRRLLAMAHGITKLPDLIRRRRFGMQMPPDFLGIFQVDNTRCPCCTHSITPVKMSLSMAALAISKRSLRPLKPDTRRCYLCGYLVCVNCWNAEYLESTVGRVVAIVVCTRCHASVKSSEAYTTDQWSSRRLVNAIEDQNNDSIAPMLTDFLEAALVKKSTSAEYRAAVVSVVQMMLQQGESTDDERDGSSYGDSDSELDESFSEQQNDNVPVVK